VTIEFNRAWAMPNSSTFAIKPINELIHKYLKPKMVSIDPFAGISKLAHITNDLDPSYKCGYSMDALDFLKSLKTGSINIVFFDPPANVKDVAAAYKKAGMIVTQQMTQSAFWSKVKLEIARVTHKNSIVISTAWNSGGIGKTLGFEIQEILLVAHGGWHNDTIVTVEKKL
jgi:hypothetical protein